MTTKAEVVDMFKTDVMPSIRKAYESDGDPDWVARSEAWNDYTDMLRDEGVITSHQYDTWTHPAICGD